MALNTGFVGAESFTIKDSLDYLVAIAIGGLGTIFGSVVGGAFLAFQVYITALLSHLIKNGDQLLWAVYGTILIFVMIFAPKGIVGEISHRLYSHFFRLPQRRQYRRKPFLDYELDEELRAGSADRSSHISYPDILKK